MDLLDVLGGVRSGSRGMSTLKMALIGVLAYRALKGHGCLADALGVGLPSGSGFQGILSGATGRSILATGLRDLLDRFRDHGQGDRVQSWVSIGPNKPIAPHELALTLGEEQVAWLVHETALPRDELMAGLGGTLPELVDQLTPDGRLPTEGISGMRDDRNVDAVCVGSENGRQLATPSVLIVEDEIVLRMATADEFREGGFFVNEAANGDEAVAMLRSYSNIDAVFSDVRMPGALDGIGLAEWVRKRYPNIRMFLTSGALEAFPTNQTIADGYFSKPYVTAEVERAIKQVCKKTVPYAELAHMGSGLTTAQW